MLRNLIKSLSNVRGSSARTLYTAEALGVDKYLYSKDKVSAQFVNSADKFKNKMLEYLSPEHMIFTEDLKNMVHLVADAEDIDLVEKMTKKFHSQNKELRFGNYVFGEFPALNFIYHACLNSPPPPPLQDLSSCGCFTL